MNFNILEHPICLSLPRRIVPYSSWRQHIPFAMLLVDVLKPRTLVELGVHYGDSYCAFCQAVAELQLRTTCYGVDTWKGDAHTSSYGSNVLPDLKSHHDPLYGSFSNLIQSSFDEALQHFGDGTIDILHIDGYHTYEAVRHDFETWLPKVSSRGVILFHDISEKQTDFGVWKLWDELKAKYPHFEFLHEHGLGLIAVGENPPEKLNWLFHANDKQTTAIQQFFFSLGSRLTGRVTLSVKQDSATAGEIGIDALAIRAELETIRNSVFFKLAWKLRSLVNIALPLYSRRRGLAVHILDHVRAWFARGGQQSVQEQLNKRTELARKYLRGVGLAIGSFDPSLIVSPNVSIDCVDSPKYENLSELKTSKPRSQPPCKSTKGHQVRLIEVSDETYDFVIFNQLPGNVHPAIEVLQNWLRVIKPGGIFYITTPVGSVLSKSISDFQAKGLEISILDSAINLADGSEDQIYIIEKANYVSKITDMLRKNPHLNAEYTIDVVVPIYNAYDDFLKCLYSLFKYQDIYRIIFLDDCSTDTRMKDLLQTLKDMEQERFKIEANSRNLGYLKTINKGIRMVKNDVILLNTDTIVTLGWARKMRTCAYSNDNIATVTPFTNNGRMVSVPNFLQDNKIPEGFTVDSFAECVENASSNRYPKLLTAVGFCMYIRKNVIDEVGYFDETNFEKGYGEEADFSFRAAYKGYKNVLCDNTFIFHKGRASFLDTQAVLMKKNHKVLAKKYPEFWEAIILFERSNPLKGLHNRLEKEMKSGRFRRKNTWVSRIFRRSAS